MSLTDRAYLALKLNFQFRKIVQLEHIRVQTTVFLNPQEPQMLR